MPNDIVEKTLTALLHHFRLESRVCNCCRGSGRRPGEYWEKEGNTCFECGGSGLTLHEIYE